MRNQIERVYLQLQQMEIMFKIKLMMTLTYGDRDTNNMIFIKDRKDLHLMMRREWNLMMRDGHRGRMWMTMMMRDRNTAAPDLLQDGNLLS